MRALKVMLLLCLFSGCSFMHMVRLENKGKEPVTVSYKLNSADRYTGVFLSSPMVMRKQNGKHVPDTTIAINPLDSVVRFTLGPGDRTVIAYMRNATLENSMPPHPLANVGNKRSNLIWFRVEHSGRVQTYLPEQLMELAVKSKMQQTVLRVSG